MSEPTKTVSLWIELMPGWQDYYSILPYIMNEEPKYTITNGSKLVRVIIDLPCIPETPCEVVVAKTQEESQNDH